MMCEKCGSVMKQDDRVLIWRCICCNWNYDKWDGWYKLEEIEVK